MLRPNLAWFLLIAIVIGHFGIHLAIYNRVNATGLPRRVTKRISKFFFVLAISIPTLITLLFFSSLRQWLVDGTFTLIGPWYVTIYGVLCLASWLFLGIPWLMWRPLLGVEWVKAERSVESVDVQTVVGLPLALTTRCKFESKLPLNQIFEMAKEQVTLPVVGLPPRLDGYRIAHLSDIHLTGHIHPSYAKYAVAEAMRWRPDMMILSGDIIDKQVCVDWLPEIFSQAEAVDGCYYVLGNHDTRIADSRQTRQAMDWAGWTDLGCTQVDCLLRGERVQMIGNEYPWFDRPRLPPSEEGQFRILVSHSPDQIWWARKHGIQLMFAGHTHGGQGRLPLIGPLLSPSYHGTRFASGDFYKAPTTMHVSRGLGGCHLLRIHCRPELSLVTLTVG
ncbi:phosphodiesterase YaeI [Planctomycetes bacterium CA13]|uniref:Phosphodiesterase YaeI n=1 Tax=Novipirellula herctigrandis TaxID=2527986 RepID=A0A5C5Z6C4_9BACT|nr:phosphodiesterase YaeI [Planctomycetes bacterium CA13]